MYSDNNYEDLGYDDVNTLGGNNGYTSNFDINDFGLNSELFSDPIGYSSSSNINNPLLQTIQRNTSSNNSDNLAHDFVPFTTTHIVGNNNINNAGMTGLKNLGHHEDNGVDENQPIGMGMGLGHNSAILGYNGSPQPSTIKKLKSHLSGIGGMGGYLTSPMGMFRNNNNNNNLSASPHGGQNASTSGHASTASLVNSSPLKPVLGHASQQQQQPVQQQSHQLNYATVGNPVPRMERFQSAPAVSNTNAEASTSSSASNAILSRPSSRNTGAIPNNNNKKSSNLEVPTNDSNVPQSFSDLDYGSMRIYGRPLVRSASEDPSASGSNNGLKGKNGAATGDAGFLPYPGQLPTLTLGRGMKGTRDIVSPSQHASFPMTKQDSEPVGGSSLSTTSKTGTGGGPPHNKPFTNLDKPYIQYVAPNSPAAKSAAARNKKSLSVNTSGEATASASAASTKATSSKSASTTDTKRSGKMIPIRMPQHYDLPLTPPISATTSNSAAMMSPQHSQTSYTAYNDTTGSYQSAQYATGQQFQQQHQNQNQIQDQQQQQQQQQTFFSPSRTNFHFASTMQQNPSQNSSQLQQPMSANMPSFEFSLEQFSDPQADFGGQLYGNTQLSNNDGNAIDFSSVLGLPSPSHHSDSHFSSTGSSHGQLSPPPHSQHQPQPPLSAASTHSSVFADDQMALFGLPPAPYFEENQTIDQALASLLGTQNVNLPSRDSASTPQPHVQAQLQLQAQNTFSPHHNQHQHQQQQLQSNLGVSSPPLSPLHGGYTSPVQSSWAPYTQSQQHSNNHNNGSIMADIDPSLQALSNHGGNGQQNLNLLSPQSAHSHYNNNYLPSDNTGRLMSSPRRLRGMQSAPDLGGMYSDQSNGFNDAFGITSPASASQRKISLKRGRQDYGDSDEENNHGYDYEGTSSDLGEDDDDNYTDGQYGSRPPPRKRANSTASRSARAPSSSQSTTVASVLLPLVNPNPARLRPGPKPKASLPNLQAAHQGVFQVSPRAPPVPAFPPQFLATSPRPDGTVPDPSGSGMLSPDPDTGFLRPQGGVSKDMLATFYSVGAGSKQTKKGKPQRMYICSIPGCAKEFPRKSAVESHIQTHLEDKPFTCPYDNCGASFVRSHDLTRHVRIHSGSKPFQCICGKGFARGDALTRHRQRGICEGSLVPRRW